MCRPLAVQMYTPRSLKTMLVGSAAFSMSRASIKCWHMSLAISRDMVNVVVVVVVMILAGSFGSADRFDWENLRDDRLRHASSLGTRRRCNSGTIKGRAGGRGKGGLSSAFVTRVRMKGEIHCELIRGGSERRRKGDMGETRTESPG